MGHSDLLEKLGRIRQDLKPYSISGRLLYAQAYEDLHYPDLAAGEAYKALLLIDQVDNEDEYCEEVIAALKRDTAAGWGRNCEPSRQVDLKSELDTLSRAAYLCLVRNLVVCGCLQSAGELALQMVKKHPDLESDSVTRLVREQLRKLYEKENVSYDKEKSLEYVRDDGIVRRELYPWNVAEPDRCSRDCVILLNEMMQEFAPKLEVQAVELPSLSNESSVCSEIVKQLGVFAKEDLAPGETILLERSLLTATSRLHEAYCDACSTKLDSSAAPNGNQDDPVSCEECQEAVFCSVTCHDLAQASYHPSLCDRDVSALAKDVPARESADALYCLLLLRVLAMSHHQDISPLELQEVRYIWGDYQDNRGPPKNIHAPPDDPFGGYPRTLPFSFKYNILLPLNMLEKMDVNIFESGERYSTWVLNTLYAKFRGTASARQGPDGKPEVGAVHPMWCLANHSCDPNVAWDWQGTMKFTVRESRVLWTGKSEQERARAGVVKGEEILSHYCDIDLNVQNRREWAAGALGGMCRCDRCLWEAQHEPATSDSVASRLG